jgi:hypothetical protein
MDASSSLTDAPQVCAQLRACGVWATLLPRDSPERIDRGPFASGAVIRIDGRHVAQLRLVVRGAVGPRQTLGAGAFGVGLGGVPIAGRTVLPVRYEWIVLRAPEDRRAFEAKLRLVTRGFFRREIVDLAWSGSSRLAEALAHDGSIRAALSGQIAPDEKLFVEPDRGRGVVRIVHRTNMVLGYTIIPGPKLVRENGLPSPPLIDAIERIAWHVRSMP